MTVASGGNNPGTEIRPGQGGPEKPQQERQQQAPVNTGRGGGRMIYLAAFQRTERRRMAN